MVARFRPMNSREKEISTNGVDEKGFKIQCAAKPPTATELGIGQSTSRGLSDSVGLSE